MIRSFAVGRATVAVISIGDVTLPLAATMGVPPSALVSNAQLRDLAGQVVIPLQSVLIRTPDTATRSASGQTGGLRPF